VAVFSVIALVFLGYLGVWDDTMTTLAMVISAVAFCAAVGIPLGILAARSNTLEAVLRPALDVMQTIPPFAYLVRW
jgi:glycine betaine/proline transport system permease protein